jgi:hypothetical protein
MAMAARVQDWRKWPQNDLKMNEFGKSRWIGLCEGREMLITSRKAKEGGRSINNKPNFWSAHR